ncbi:hypothetical protein POV27_07070 [Aureisphaera galaxeae]|uniref:hypothetical protein n=1 Tax=Aureisphaera galaxeae TaxID=1538023 RepID=UPI002350D0B0|nr:hypothetical protein [Aureisphaera galaxeae]MDC8003806.1 hypothetical protein [Aureisphaera galaxeae]
MGNTRRFYFFLFTLLVALGCSTDNGDNTSEEGMEEVLPPALKNTQVNVFVGEPVDWLLELTEAGKPMSGPNYDFVYDSEDRLIESVIINISNGWDFSETRRFGYENGQLNSFAFSSFLSSDGIAIIPGDILVNENVIEHQFFEGTHIVRYTFLDESFTYLTKLEYLDLDISSEPYNYFEFEYDDEFLLVECREYKTNNIVGGVPLWSIYEIEYDDKINPYHYAFRNFHPFVFGFLKFRQDRDALNLFEPYLRRNMRYNVTRITRTNQFSGSVFSWEYEFTYNDENLPLTKIRSLDDGTIFDAETYEYYETP